MKLAGANAFLLIAAAATGLFVRSHEMSAGPVIAVLATAFIAALMLNIALVSLAVRPMKKLENTVDSLWRGDLTARVPGSLLADRNVARVGHMFNILLDGLLADRTRTRRLAAELINAGDRERASMSRELHDSTAQSLAALVMRLSVLARDAHDMSASDLDSTLDHARALATTALEEVRMLAHAMHPRVLDDLGLIAAVRRLARDTSGDEIIVEVVAREGVDEDIPPTQASVLYRVAQEAIRNACRHAAATHVEIRISADVDSARLEITDDGVGFDPETVMSAHAGMGLFTMRERVALIEGELHVTSRVGGGTTVLATVPLRDTNPPFTTEGPDE
ncbi:MAG: sensor histidine kinase [Gemmatimonadaceae bacterium]